MISCPRHLKPCLKDCLAIDRRTDAWPGTESVLEVGICRTEHHIGSGHDSASHRRRPGRAEFGPEPRSRAVLQAPPGAGKTTACRRLCWGSPGLKDGGF